MSYHDEVSVDQVAVDFDDVEIIGSDADVAIIDRDDVSNYNPENILPEEPEIISKIRHWLGPTDYSHGSGEFRKHLAAHMPGTGKWLFAKPNYQKWHDGDDNGLLWIKGIPGSGKSVFAATLVDELSKEGHPVLFFFFRQIIEANHKPVNLLRDWLDQILEYSPPLQAELKPFVDEKSGNGHSIDKLNIDDLWKYLKRALVSMPRVYLVADALDEMDKGNNEFLQALAKLGSWKPAAVKMVITSRPVNTVEEPLRGIPILKIRLEEKLVDVDIAAFVQRGIDSSTIPVEDRQLITEAVPGRANGLFLYAKLAMDAFLEPNANIRQVLGSLPADLNDMYTGLLQEHARRSGVATDVQILILSWVTHATRPLRLIELAEFVRASHVGEPHIDIKTAKGLVRAACGPLLEILSDETISVIHHSLTEFLNGSTRLGQDSVTLGIDGKSSGLFPVLTPRATHECLAVSCLQYLVAGCLDGMKCNKTMENGQLFKRREEVTYEVARLGYPSLTYAAENWVAHAFKVTNDGSILSSILSSYLDEFLQQGPRFDAWLDIEWRPGPAKNVTPCHVVARYGLTSYLYHLVRRYPSKDVIDARDADNQTPLFLAASEGHAEAVKILVTAGADPDAEEIAGLKPLHQAAKANHMEVAKALVEAGVSPLTKKTKEYPGRWCGNSPSTVGQTPLMYACEAGHLEVLEVFLPHLLDDKDACNAGKLEVLKAFRPRSTDYYDYGDLLDQAGSLPDLEGKGAYYLALGWASVCGRSKLVKRLLEHPGIELDTETYGKHAFNNACRNGDLQSMEAILQAGVTPTTSDLNQFLLGCSSAWSYAKCRYKPHETDIDDIKRGLDLFLGAGVPIERCNLHFAVANPLLLRLLLQAGADPNVESEDGTTLLHRSLKGEAGWEVVVLLVEEGKADVNRKTRSGGKSPLQGQIEASECHVENCIRFIERYHPDCTLTDKKGQGPLTSLVTSRGTFVGGTLAELGEKLVAAGASLNQQDHAGKTPIHYAEEMEVVTFFVRLGADINARDHSGTTRLMDRVRRGPPHKEIDEMIALGARLDVRDFRGRTLLHQILPDYISRNRRNHLIALGMDPLVTDYSGNTLLHELVAAYRTSFYTEKDFVTAFAELMDLGVNPNTPNNSGQTALHMLITKGASKTIPSQVLECCDMECADYNGLRPIHLAAKVSGGSVFGLIAAGVDAFPTTYQGETPLHFAAESQDSNTVGILLDILGTGKYGDPSNIIDARDERGRTALYYACKAGRPETVALLLGAGATLKATKLLDVMDAFLSFRVHHRTSIRLPHEYELDMVARRGVRFKGHGPIGTLAESETVRLEEIVDMLLAKGLSFEEPKSLLLLEEAINQGLENRLDYNVRCMRKLLPRTSNTQMEGTSRPSFRRPDGLFNLNNPFTSRWVELRDQSSSTALDETQFLSSIAGRADAQMQLMMELLRQRQFDLVEELFKVNSFDPLLRAHNGTTPLHTLVSMGYWRIVRKVVTVDKLPILESLESLIRTACERELPNMEVLQILVERLRESLSARRMEAERADSGSMAEKFKVSPLYAVVQGWWQVRQALPFLLSLPPNLRPDLECEDPSGDTPLIRALQDSGGIYRKEAARVLIEAGANVNATYKGTQTCLSLAGGDLELVRLLLEHGATVTGDALFGAIQSNYEELVRLFLSSGADPNMRHHVASSHREWRPLKGEFHPLYWAATKSSGKIVRQLLDHGADPFAKCDQFTLTDEGDNQVYKRLTVLHEIINNNGIIEPFFEALPNLDLEQRNEDGETLLLTACRSPGAFLTMVTVHGEDRPLGEILLKRGACTHAVDSLNRNILHLLMLSLQTSNWWNEELPLSRRCFELLLAQTPTDLLSQKADGVVIHLHPGMGTMNTPLHLALQNAVAERFARVEIGGEEGGGLRIIEDDSEAIIDLFLEAGSDPLASNGEGDTALHLLARGMEWRPISRRLFEKFLGLGLDINATNNAGETPLFVFVKSPPIGGSDVLLYEGADCEDAWRVFIESGADFRARDHEGRTLLHAVACSKLDAEAAGSLWVLDAELRNLQRVGRFKRLMGMGLDPFCQDDKMRSSLDVAVACGDSGILELFKEDGSEV